jgi:hypothetical protein
MHLLLLELSAAVLSGANAAKMKVSAKRAKMETLITRKTMVIAAVT